MGDKIAKISSGVLLHDVGEEAVFLNIDTHQYYSLNSVGTRMLHLLFESASFEQVVELLTIEYDISAQEVSQDLSALVKRLCEQGLIELC